MTKALHRLTRLSLFLSITLLASGCSYRWGYVARALPGDEREVAIPIFTNLTDEVAVEPVFTQALVRQFIRSKVAKVVDSEKAPLVIRGQIDSIEYKRGTLKEGGKDDVATRLPPNTVLTTEYRILVTVSLRVQRLNDQSVLWEGQFNNERVYAAPQIGLPILNSANPLYNQSARHENLRAMANEMMSEAHDRMTENF